MRLKTMTGIALLLGGCGFFTEPKIVDITDKTVRVRYVNTGSRDLNEKALRLVAEHCGQGGFRITKRTVEVTYRNVTGEPTEINIDAVCL
jgi:hypothetical protein